MAWVPLPRHAPCCLVVVTVNRSLVLSYAAYNNRCTRWALDFHSRWLTAGVTRVAKLDRATRATRSRIKRGTRVASKDRETGIFRRKRRRCRAWIISNLREFEKILDETFSITFLLFPFFSFCIENLCSLQESFLYFYFSEDTKMKKNSGPFSINSIA